MLMSCGKHPLTLGLALLLLGSAYLGLTTDMPNPLIGFAQAAEQSQPVQHQKPLVVGIHADWCSGCRNIEPAMMNLMKEYKGKVQFVTLDVTNAKSSQEAAKKAKALGLADWFEKNKTKTSTVAIIEPSSKQVIKTFMNNPDVQAYEAALNPLLK